VRLRILLIVQKAARSIPSDLALNSGLGLSVAIFVEVNHWLDRLGAEIVTRLEECLVQPRIHREGFRNLLLVGTSFVSSAHDDEKGSIAACFCERSSYAETKYGVWIVAAGGTPEPIGNPGPRENSFKG
jgi:hypothetical protein